MFHMKLYSYRLGKIAPVFTVATLQLEIYLENKCFQAENKIS